MGVLYLIRHGQASLGTADYDQLSGLGRRQARLAGRRLAQADLRAVRVVSGALRRQQDTALEVIPALGIHPAQLTTDRRLNEYDHVSVLGAHTPDITFESATDSSSGRALQLALDDALRRWAAAGAGPYAESHDGFLQRVTDVFTQLAAQPGTTLAVTSGGVIAVACVRMLALPASRWPDLARVLVNSGLTKVICGESGISLSSFNDHAHLEGDRSLITYR